MADTLPNGEEVLDFYPPPSPAKKVYKYAWINWCCGDMSGNDPYAIYEDDGGMFIMAAWGKQAEKIYLTPNGKKPKGNKWAQMWD